MKRPKGIYQTTEYLNKYIDELLMLIDSSHSVLDNAVKLNIIDAKKEDGSDMYVGILLKQLKKATS